MDKAKEKAEIVALINEFKKSEQARVDNLAGWRRVTEMRLAHPLTTPAEVAEIERQFKEVEEQNARVDRMVADLAERYFAADIDKLIDEQPEPGAEN